jgi:hypothetical protein
VRITAINEGLTQQRKPRRTHNPDGVRMYIKSIDAFRITPKVQDNPPSNPIKGIVRGVAFGLVLWTAIGATFYAFVL